MRFVKRSFRRDLPRRSSMEARVTGYFSDIWRLRYFWLALVKIDLRKRYRGTALGIGWSLLQPIAMTAVLCLVFSRIFGEPIRDFAPYLLTGLTFWGFVTAVVTQGCESFFQGEPYIRQHPAPLAIYPLRAMLGAGFHFLLGMVLALAFVWCFKGFGNLPALIGILPALAILFVVGWALAICMGVVNVLFQDSQHLIGIVMQMLFYLTPILYKPEIMLSRSPRFAVIFSYNPLATLLELVRKPLLDGELPSLWSVGVSAAFAFLIAGIAVLALRCFEKRMVFYL